MGSKIPSHRSKTLWAVIAVVAVIVVAAAIPILSSKTIVNKNGSSSTYGSSETQLTSSQALTGSTATSTYGNSGTLLLFDQYAGVWTTDKPANYSNLVTLVFQTAEKGVLYELVGNSYMAETFNYTVTNGGTAQTSNSAILQITKSGSPMQEVPFSLQGNSLNLHYEGTNVTLVRDFGNMSSLNNEY